MEITFTSLGNLQIKIPAGKTTYRDTLSVRSESQTWNSVVQYEADDATNKHTRAQQHCEYLICDFTA